MSTLGLNMSTDADADVVVASPKTRHELYARYSESVANFRNFECNILRLMRNPDTKPEHLEAVRGSYVDLFKRMTDAHQLLTSKAMGRHVARPSLTAYHDREGEK